MPFLRRSGKQRSSSEHFPAELFGFVGSLTQDMLETIPAKTPKLPCLSLSALLLNKPFGEGFVLPTSFLEVDGTPAGHYGEDEIWRL